MKLLPSFFCLIACFLMYQYFISINIDYDILGGVVVTCLPATLFTMSLSLLVGLSLTLFKTPYWSTGLFFLLISGVLNYFGMTTVLTHPLLAFSDIKITQSCLILIWFIGVTSPFTFFNSMATWAQNHLKTLSAKTPSTESSDSPLLWSRTYQRAPIELFLLLCSSYVVCILMCIVIIFMEPLKGLIVLPVVCILSSMVGWSYFKYQKTRGYKGIRLSIPRERKELILEGGFVGNYTLASQEIARIQARTWTVQSSDSSLNNSSTFTVLEVLLHDGGVLQLISPSDDMLGSDIQGIGKKIAAHFEVEYQFVSADTCTWKKDFLHHSSQNVPSNSPIDSKHGQLNIQKDDHKTVITYTPQLSTAGSQFLTYQPFLYSSLGAGFSGLAVMILIGESPNIVLTIILYVVAVLTTSIIYKKNTQHLTCEHIITLADDQISFSNGDKTHSIPNHLIRYARINLNLEQRSVSLFVGIPPESEIDIELEKDHNNDIEGVALIKIEESWFQNKVEDLRAIEQLIEQKYRVQ